MLSKRGRFIVAEETFGITQSSFSKSAQLCASIDKGAQLCARAESAVPDFSPSTMDQPCLDKGVSAAGDPAVALNLIDLP